MSCQFPYYSGNIYKSEALGVVTIEQFIDAHRNPKDETYDLICDIRTATFKGDKEKKNELKTKLFAFTPAVLIEKGDKRKYENIKEFTGLMQLDFDGMEDEEIAEGLKRHIFDTHTEIVCAYTSPSRLGVKALMKIKIPLDIDHYKAIHKAVSKEMEQYGYFDNATKNAILPLFLSIDEEILSRDFDTCDVWSKEDWSVVDYKQLNAEPKTHRDANDYYYKKVVRIITKRINDIVDNGHPQVRSTALVLGSRVGAGYISQTEAEYLIEKLIKDNTYLQKGIKGYVRTAMWGIKNGINNPKYF